MIVDLIENTDHKVNRAVDKNQIPLFTQFFDSLTALGSFYFSLIITSFLWSFGETLIARQLGVGLIVTGAVTFTLKYASERERPANHIENLVSRASFPSGHSGNAFMTAVILSSHLDRSIGFFSLAFTIAASRVYLEDHYLSDAVVGSGIGLVIGQILITV